MRVCPLVIQYYPHYITARKGKLNMEKSSNKLVDLSVAFAVEILNLVKYLKSHFVSKLQIALKESNETSYWLLLLSKTNIISPVEYNRLENLCKEIRITLIASVNTTKRNDK